jgi:hypothetical protein
MESMLLLSPSEAGGGRNIRECLEDVFDFAIDDGNNEINNYKEYKWTRERAVARIGVLPQIWMESKDVQRTSDW